MEYYKGIKDKVHQFGNMDARIKKPQGMAGYYGTIPASNRKPFQLPPQKKFTPSVTTRGELHPQWMKDSRKESEDLREGKYKARLGLEAERYKAKGAASGKFKDLSVTDRMKVSDKALAEVLSSSGVKDGFHQDMTGVSTKEMNVFKQSADRVAKDYKSGMSMNDAIQKDAIFVRKKNTDKAVADMLKNNDPTTLRKLYKDDPQGYQAAKQRLQELASLKGGDSGTAVGTIDNSLRPSNQ